MSKTTTPEMDDHLEEEVTTLARCWRITRTDDVEFFFTDHDEALLFEGNTYVSLEGFSPTAVTSNASLDVDNLNVVGIFDDDSIQEDEIAAGLFDYAQVHLFAVNWADLTMGPLKMRRGWFGEAIKSPSGLFKVELRGMTQVLQQSIGELYGPECRTDVGSNRCKVPIQPDLVLRSTSYAVGDYVRVATLVSTGQAQYENRIYKCIHAGVTAAVAPTYDTTVGNETDDGGTAVGGTVANYTPGVNFSAAQTINIDDIRYTFAASLVGSTSGVVLIGAGIAASMSNLYNAIVGGAGAGTVYDASTPVNATVTASLAGGTNILTIGLADPTIPGQQVVLSEVSPGAWDVSSLGTTSNTAVFQAVEAWSRNFTVTSVSSRRVFSISVTDARAVDGWFDGGVAVFESGDNAISRGFEVKSWVNSGGVVTLYLPVGFAIMVGDTGRIYPGCDKRLATCRDRFANLLNFRGEPYLPGRDAAFQYPDAK
jgi:hypothetical protein